MFRTTLKGNATVLKIAEAKKQDVSFGNQTARVIVQGDTIDEVNSLQAKQLAFDQQVALGLSRCGVETMGGAYVVEGVERSQEEIDAMPLHLREPMMGKAYRRDFKLTQML